MRGTQLNAVLALVHSQANHIYSDEPVSPVGVLCFVPFVKGHFSVLRNL